MKISSYLKKANLDLIGELDIVPIYDAGKLKIFSKKKKDFVDEFEVASYSRFNEMAEIIMRRELLRLEFCKSKGIEYQY